MFDDDDEEFTLTNEEFSEFVLNMRAAAGASRQRLADLMGVQVRTIKEYEESRRKPAGKRIVSFIYRLREVVKDEIRRNREIGKPSDGKGNGRRHSGKRGIAKAN